jgi:flavin reductase (DIM6/NTAB) family NADH-FMN oxidoreductase RutF
MMESHVDTGQLLRYSTSTVGLITSVGPRGTNVMTAEWTYMVARRPPHFAVGCQTTNYSTRLILDRGEFGLTLCDASMASLAEFEGSFSGADVDKLPSAALELRDPVVTGCPTVIGGPLSAECRVVNVVDLPDYALVVGEAVWLTTDEVANKDPLVKHGGMYQLGEEIRSMLISASATACPDGSVRVCAVAQGVDPESETDWTVALRSNAHVLHTTTGGDCLDVVIPPPARHLPGDHLVIARSDCQPAHVALPRLAGEPPDRRGGESHA